MTRSAPSGAVRWRGLWLLLAVFFVVLGTRGLNEPDEGRYAEMAREMADGGSWLVPTLDGFEHLTKPPLIYWTTAVCLRLFGPNEWAARLPSALAACGIVLLTMSIARRFWGETRARVAAVLLAATLEFFALARTLTPDMLMSFFITAAIAALVHERRWLFFAMMGLGFLTKGPMAFVIPLGAAAGARLARDKAPPGLRLPWGRGLVLAFAIALSWFIGLSLTSPSLFKYFWHDELFNRVASGRHGRSQPFWFFVPVLLAGLLPWTHLLPGRIRDAWRGLRGRTLTPSAGLLLGWVVPGFAVLSLSGSKLITYILPLYPAFALAFSGRFPDVRAALKIAVPALAVMLAAVSLLPLADPWLGRMATVRPLVETLRSQPRTEEATIFACGVRAHGFEFYLGRLVHLTEAEADIVLPATELQRARIIPRGQNCARVFRDRLAYGLVSRREFEHRFRPLGWTELGHSGDFVLVGNAELINTERTANPARP